MHLNDTKTAWQAKATPVQVVFLAKHRSGPAPCADMVSFDGAHWMSNQRALTPSCVDAVNVKAGWYEAMLMVDKVV